jgi:hypothetical protein
MRYASLALVALFGCTGELHELDPGDMQPGGGPAPDGGSPQARDGGPRGAVDMAQAPAVTFASSIQGDLDNMSCTSSACHGGGTIPMNLVANATMTTDLAANYAQVQMRASSGSSSLILQKNLSGGMSHTGGHPFMTTSDPTYVKWLGWINAGAPSGLGDGGM